MNPPGSVSIGQNINSIAEQTTQPVAIAPRLEPNKKHETVIGIEPKMTGMVDAPGEKQIEKKKARAAIPKRQPENCLVLISIRSGYQKHDDQWSMMPRVEFP